MRILNGIKLLLIDVGRLAELLADSNYNSTKSQFLVDGFTNGFDIG